MACRERGEGKYNKGDSKEDFDHLKCPLAKPKKLGRVGSAA
jgi:hypothetical protein